MALSRLKPDSATMVGILTAMGVYLIYNNALPTATDVRASMPHDTDVEGARKAAAWKSAGLIAVVFLVARDVNSYIISGGALVGIDYLYKHMNGVHPTSGQLDSDVDESLSMASVHPMPDYADMEA